ncbi:hypothetical protein KFK09_008451 [Dendrobium nobile]|uniref:Uncharacterized protein n=1 Tax=Dendrobium nobile TaxID=94219 RepID=A0A8T3BK59_DENNO|nr:hypothetical protein KFK09_008451 [Dendrobium nobile]
MSQRHVLSDEHGAPLFVFNLPDSVVAPGSGAPQWFALCLLLELQHRGLEHHDTPLSVCLQPNNTAP